ncbi:MAG TPA: M48 family peptidase [Terriglobia bacterium]
MRKPPQLSRLTPAARALASPFPGSSSNGRVRFWGVQLNLWGEVPSEPAVKPAQSEKRLLKSASLPAIGETAPPAAAPSDAALAEVFARVFRRLRPGWSFPSFEVRLRRFTGLRSAIRLKKNDVIEAHLSDLLEQAPPLVIEALAEILITHLFRIRTSREANECYKAWTGSSAVARRVEEIRRARSRKRLLPPQGCHFNLVSILEDLNGRFFGGRLGHVRIGWSPKRSRTMLGHYDSSHHSITVTRWLDARRVPRYVVEYLVFHEMLHAQFPVERRNHRRIVHSEAFCEAERRFPHYERAVRWLKGSSRRRAGRMPRPWGAIDGAY